VMCRRWNRDRRTPPLRPPQPPRSRRVGRASDGPQLPVRASTRAWGLWVGRGATRRLQPRLNPRSLHLPRSPTSPSRLFPDSTDPCSAPRLSR